MSFILGARVRDPARSRRHLLLIALLMLAVAALLVVPDALAQNFGLDTAAGGAIPKTKDIAKIIANILKAALGFVGTLFLLLMVYAGFLWMTARGDSKKVDQAKQMITGAIIGVVVIASAYAITSFVIGAATGTGSTGGGSQTQADIPDRSVATGGTCQVADDCTKVTDICENTKCVSSTNP